jgi:exodeoxyribonuclease V alpha subunit
VSRSLPFDADKAARGRGKSAGQEAVLGGSLTSITFRNEDNGYTVARIEVEGRKQPVTVVGVMPGVEVGDTLALRGHWSEHSTYGRQLEVTRCELRLPSGRVGLIKFLGGGRIAGVGPKTAEKIVDALGVDVLARLERDPDLLATVVSAKKAKTILAQLEEQKASAAAIVFLADNGLGPGQSQRVWRAYRERTVEVVRANPWRMADEVAGIGFKLADTVARHLGHETDSSDRVSAGLRYLLRQAALDGHVGLPTEMLVEQGAVFLGVDESRAEEVLVATLEQGELVEDGLIYRPELLAAERAVADGLRARLADAAPLVDVAPEVAVQASELSSGVELSDDQRRALAVALSARVSVITGGPGVGKTTIIRCLLDVLREGGKRAALAAPTGRAARRLSEATGRQASTLHRLLGILPTSSGFRRERPEPIEQDVLIVDETSMVDVELMAIVVESLPPGVGLVLVGDVDQLPSVGPGEVLRAFIESGVVPVARLSTIFRQSEHSGIVRVAHELNAGEVPVFDEGPDGQAFFVERDDPADALEAIRAMVVDRIPKRFGLHPLRDVQVLTPMHGGPLGTIALNETLREALNPPAPGRAEINRFGRLYRQGDKVMQVRNNYDLNVFNGDVGLLASVNEEVGKAVVDFEGRRVEYGLDALDQLEPAFAITCHKSQGSEFPAVVLPLVSAHFVMLRRNLVYTAFTRARQVLVAVGQWRALSTAAAAEGSGYRHSRLAERLRGEA